MLRLPANIMYRSLVFMPALHEIIASSKEHSDAVNKNSPVHVRRRGIRHRRKEQKHKCQCEEGNGECINEVAPIA